MKKVFLVACCWVLVTGISAQTVTQRLQKAFTAFEKDEQLKHAISSLYVIDAKTGKVVFDQNSQIGLAPASTQKIITAVTAFELLGKDYRYKTELGYTGNIKTDTLQGNLYIKASGDPTFGSWRYANATDSAIKRKWAVALNKTGIRIVTGILTGNYNDYSHKSIPDGWIWQDIGNYYGAPADILNWKENQFDIELQSGSEVGSEVKILGSNLNYFNELKAAPKGTGDNAYAYIYQGMKNPLIAGTIPVDEKSFKISVSDPDAVTNAFLELSISLGIKSDRVHKSVFVSPNNFSLLDMNPKNYSVITIHYSPSLDSIIYWFNKKSINLYGEALIKTFAYEKQGFGSTDSGISIVKKFWKGKGIDKDELNIYDGSGLSPQNRVTTHAQVEILKYAKTKDWFPYFYDALPEYNGMKMKSGTIRDVKGFCGYHKATNGKEYIFSFLVNNYNGKTSGVVNKMYKVLDELK